MKGSAVQQQPLDENMSNLTSASGEASVSNDNGGIYPPQYTFQAPPPLLAKKKRNQPGHPDPDAEVIAMSPRALLATNRFVCEICNKGFQRDQNLQLHRRGHNLPWKLKQRTSKEVRKKVYVCPEMSCVHHDPSRALGDLTGIKKHFCRKHGEKKWKCDKCSKKYAVQSDWKAHSKTCGTREYRCDCGTLFSRRDSFVTHRAFCDALAEESARSIGRNQPSTIPVQSPHHMMNLHQMQSHFNTPTDELTFSVKKEHQNFSFVPEVPQWLACPTTIGPPHTLIGQPPLHLTPPTPIFQHFQQTQDFPQAAFDQDRHQGQNPNPNCSTSLGPTSALPPYHRPPTASSPHISATALLQKASQMGAKSSASSPAGVFIRPPHPPSHVPAAAAAGESGPCCGATGFGLDLLCSRDEFLTGLASYGNKAAAAAPMSAGGTNNNSDHHQTSFIHDMMMNNHGFGGSTFEDMGFAEFMNQHQQHQTLKKDDQDMNFDQDYRDGMMATRDFLGLRPLSQSEMMSIAGLNNCMKLNNGEEIQFKG